MEPRLWPCATALQHLGCCRHGLAQPVGGAVLTCAALVIDQGLHMHPLLDLRPAVPATRVVCQHSGPVELPHPVGVGQHGERAPHVGVGN